MSNQRLMKAKEKAGDGYAKTNAIAPDLPTTRCRMHQKRERQSSRKGRARIVDGLEGGGDGIMIERPHALLLPPVRFR